MRFSKFSSGSLLKRYSSRIVLSKVSKPVSTVQRGRRAMVFRPPNGFGVDEIVGVHLLDDGHLAWRKKQRANGLDGAAGPRRSVID